MHILDFKTFKKCKQSYKMLLFVVLKLVKFSIVTVHVNVTYIFLKA